MRILIFFAIPDPRSRGSKLKKAPDPDPKHWLEMYLAPSVEDPGYLSRILIYIHPGSRNKKEKVPGYVGQLFYAETAGEVRQLGGPGLAQQAPSRRQTTAGQPARLHRPVPVLRNTNWQAFSKVDE